MKSFFSLFFIVLLILTSFGCGKSPSPRQSPDAARSAFTNTTHCRVLWTNMVTGASGHGEWYTTKEFEPLRALVGAYDAIERTRHWIEYTNR